MLDNSKQRCLVCGELALLDEEGECEQCRVATVFPADPYLGGSNLDYRINCADSEGFIFDGEMYV